MVSAKPRFVRVRQFAHLILRGEEHTMGSIRDVGMIQMGAWAQELAKQNVIMRYGVIESEGVRELIAMAESDGMVSRGEAEFMRELQGMSGFFRDGQPGAPGEPEAIKITFQADDAIHHWFSDTLGLGQHGEGIRDFKGLQLP
jgi:hypothetical protein